MTAQSSVERHCVPVKRRRFVDKTRKLQLRVDFQPSARLLDRRSFDTAPAAYMDDATDEAREQRAVKGFYPAMNDMDCQHSKTDLKVHLCSLYLPCQPATISAAC